VQRRSAYRRTGAPAKRSVPEAFRMLLANAVSLLPPGAPGDAVAHTALDAWARVHGLAMLMLDGQIPANAALIVNYKVGGTAKTGSDYGALAGSVVIKALQSSEVITLTPVADGSYENCSESVRVTLITGIGYTLGTFPSGVSNGSAVSR